MSQVERVFELIIQFQFANQYICSEIVDGVIVTDEENNVVTKSRVGRKI